MPSKARVQERVVREAARQVVRYERWSASERGKGSEFGEDTSDDVIERYTKCDGALWARLASRALTLAKKPSFRETVA